MSSPSLVRRLAAAHRSRPADFRADLPGQAEFLAAPERLVVWYGHNGAGKTEALVRRLIRVFEGSDMICAGALRPLVLVLCVTGYDSVSCRDVARQLHDLCPPGLVAQVDLDDAGQPIGRASEWYGAAKGFRGRPPRLVVQRGPMRGTTLNITTLGSGMGAAAGGTIDLICVNEPIDRPLFEELSSRDRARALGYLWYVLTPTEDSPDQTWIPEVIKGAGSAAKFIQTRLTPEALQFPSGGRLEPWEKTATRIGKWSPVSRRQRMGESLEALLEGTYFSDVWHEANVVQRCLLRGMWLTAGVDHGLQQGRLRLVVSGWVVEVEHSIRRLRGCALAEYKGTSADLSEAAKGALAALERAGIPLESIDEWIGDRAIVADRGEIVRDNRAFRAAMLLELRRRAPPGTPEGSILAPYQLWAIETPRKKPGSHWIELNAMRADIAEGRYTVVETCPDLIEDYQRWDGNVRHRHKDGLDGVRYGRQLAVRHFGIRAD